MYFRWKEFCDRHGVSYVTAGPNTAHGHISIKCPLCGDDPSEHMGLSINPRNPAWGCWRNRDHRGKSPVRLIKALLRCSGEMAVRLVQEGNAPEFDDFEKVAADLLYGEAEAPKKEVPKRHLKFLPEFKMLDNRGYGPRFLDYLRHERGLTPAIMVAKRYDLHYTLTGPFKNRLIIPFYHDEELVGWTGRSIDGRVDLRYKMLPDDKESAERMGVKPMLVNRKKYLFQLDRVQEGGEVLVITEGPLDAIKLEWYAKNPGMVVTCVFGKPTTDQVHMLARAARDFDRVQVLLDTDAWSDGIQLADELKELSGSNVRWAALPSGTKDPGALRKGDVHEFAGKL